jgi:hypothetical protein
LLPAFEPLAEAEQRSADEQVDPEDEDEHDHDESDEHRIDACGHTQEFGPCHKAISLPSGQASPALALARPEPISPPIESP